MKGSGTDGFMMNAGSYKVRDPNLSARNAKRLERKEERKTQKKKGYKC